jgi:hypothetical protein
MPDFGPFAAELAEIIGPAVRELLRTTIGTVFLAIVVAVVDYAIAADGSVVRGLLAVVLGVVTIAVVGVILAFKRAVLSATSAGVTRLGLGGFVARAVFERMLLHGETDRAMGDRGGEVARTAERIPLAQAEQRLTSVVQELVRDEPRGGGLRGSIRRRVRRRLFDLVERLTLARFRDADEKEGGVDLLVVRDVMAGSIDASLKATISGMATRLTATLAALALFVSVVLAGLVRYLRL